MNDVEKEDNKRVVLYTIPDCPKCANLKTKLSQKNINYELCEMGEAEIAQMIERGFNSAPILDIEGQMMAYKEALKWAMGV